MNKHLKVVGKAVRGSSVTEKMPADSLRGNERKITEFQQSIRIDGYGNDLESSRASDAQNIPFRMNRKEKAFNKKLI